MKTKFSIFLLAVLLCGCAKDSQDDFLNNFTDKNKYEYLTTAQFKKQMTEQDLDILNKSEAKNEYVFNDSKKYYYGYKIKLDGDAYLISYGVTYKPLYTATFKLIGWSDTYLCIYQIGQGVVSKLKTTSSDPILSGCKEENGTYKITSFIKKYRVQDNNENKGYFVTDSIVKRYKISDNSFEEIK